MNALGFGAAGRRSDGLSRIYFKNISGCYTTLAAYSGPHLLQSNLASDRKNFEFPKIVQNGPKIVLKWSQNGPKMVPSHHAV